MTHKFDNVNDKYKFTTLMNPVFLNVYNIDGLEFLIC